ncbi:chloramphenicol resistance leader peptide [Corynebacterium striatum]
MSVVPGALAVVTRRTIS